MYLLIENFIINFGFFSTLNRGHSEDVVVWCLQGAICTGHGIRHYTRLSPKCVIKLQRTKCRTAECQVKEIQYLQHIVFLLEKFFSIYLYLFITTIFPFFRLNRELNGGAWCPSSQLDSKSSGKEWIQVNFSEPYVITKIATQGRFGNGMGVEFAETFWLHYTRDGINWMQWRNKYGEYVSFCIITNDDSQCSFFNLTQASFFAHDLTPLLQFPSAHACFSLIIWMEQQSYQQPRLPVVAGNTQQFVSHSGPSLFETIYILVVRSFCKLATLLMPILQRYALAFKLICK